MHFILASHLNFADGIYNSTKLIIGEQKNVHILNAYQDDIDFEKEAQNIIENIPKDDKIIICTDIYGGSVSNALIKYTVNKNIHLVSGMNLPLLIELFSSTDDIENSKDNTDKLIDNIINNARNSIIYCKFTKKEEEEF